MTQLEPPRTALETALIVEDDLDQAEMAASFVRLRELQPMVATDGSTGLELALRHRPDLILLDLMLPDINGFDVCQQLRANAETMAIPVVMLTALRADEHRRRGFRVGANAYVTKPYGPEDLFQGITIAQAWRVNLERERVHGEIHVELNSSSNYLREVNQFLIGLYRSTPLTTDQVHQLQQSVLEIGQNAIEWGNRLNIDKLVRITYRIFSDRVEILVLDEGPGFNRNDLAHAATFEDPLSHMDVREQLGLREGGFGLLITKGMVDEMHYNEKGNQVVLIKRFPTDGVPAPV